MKGAFRANLCHYLDLVKHHFSLNSLILSRFLHIFPPTSTSESSLILLLLDLLKYFNRSSRMTAQKAKILLQCNTFVYTAAILDSVTSSQFPTDCRWHFAKCKK